MGEVAEALATLTVSVTSPDGYVMAGIRAARLSDLVIRPGASERYTEPTLANQLARTAELLYSARDRAVARVIGRAGLARAIRPEQARDELHQWYLLRLQTVAAAGQGPAGCVSFEVEGMAHWWCRIARGTLGRLPEPEFVTEVIAAAGDLLSNVRFEKALLKNEFFGTSLALPIRQRRARRS